MKNGLLHAALILLISSCTQNSKTESNTHTTDSSSTGAAANTVIKGPGYLSELDFKNDYPTDSTVTKLYDAIDFQRACQAYIWAIPTVYITNCIWGFTGISGSILTT